MKTKTIEGILRMLARDGNKVLAQELRTALKMARDRDMAQFTVLDESLNVVAKVLLLWLISKGILPERDKKHWQHSVEYSLCKIRVASFRNNKKGWISSKTVFKEFDKTWKDARPEIIEEIICYAKGKKKKINEALKGIKLKNVLKITDTLHLAILKGYGIKAVARQGTSIRL